MVFPCICCALGNPIYSQTEAEGLTTDERSRFVEKGPVCEKHWNELYVASRDLISSGTCKFILFSKLAMESYTSKKTSAISIPISWAIVKSDLA